MLQRTLLLLRRQYRTLPMPALSPTMTTGRISAWKKKDGDAYKVDDVLCEVETDKAVVDFSAVEEGVLAKVIVQAGGEPIPVGAPLAIVVDDKDEIPKAIEEYEKQTANSGPAKAAATPTTAPPSPAAQPTKAVSKPAEPSVPQRKAEGTGKDGRIMKEDAIAYLSKQKSRSGASSVAQGFKTRAIPASTTSKPARPPAQEHWLPQERGSFKDVPLTMMRRVIAQRLSESKDRVPHMYATMNADIDSALEARNQLKKLGMSTPSMNDLVIRACALALKKVPSLNVRVDNDKIVRNEKIDISVAVATPGGLITPIIESADKKNPMEISAKIKDLAARAKENKLKPAEFQGGSFTVSNLGMFGVDDFTAIINPPQVAILAVGSGKPTLQAPSSTKRTEINFSQAETRTKMTVALSFDPRAVTEVDASKFLQSFQMYMESPAVLFSSSA